MAHHADPTPRLLALKELVCAASAESFRFLRLVEQRGEDAARLWSLRRDARELYYAIQELVGGIEGCFTATSNLGASQDRTPRYAVEDFKSDFHYLDEFSELCQKILDALPTDEEAGAISKGDHKAPEIRTFILALSRAKGRIWDAALARDVNSFHSALSRASSITADCLCEPHAGPASPTGSNSGRIAYILESCEILHSPSLDNDLVSSPHAIAHFEARNRSFPGYAEAVKTLVSHIIDEDWELVGTTILRLFGSKPHLIQWVIEYCRQTWPDRYGFRALSPLPTLSLIETALSLPTNAFGCAVAAALGLGRVCMAPQPRTLGHRSVLRRPGAIVFALVVRPRDLGAHPRPPILNGAE
jgi:hypothetical protein